MITIEEIKDKKGMRQFVCFPFSIYKSNPYWVPPLIKDEISSFDNKKNPVFEHAKARFFIALKNNSIVGRVATIVNKHETEKQGIKKIRFGWFDIIDNIQVSRALLEKVKELARQQGLKYIEGPMGFNNLDKVGVLVEGFNYTGNMATWYNYPYYKTHLEKLGFKKEKEYIEGKFCYSEVNTQKYIKAGNLIQKKYQLKDLNFSSRKQIMPYVDEMFSLLEKTYSKLPSYIPLSEKERDYFKKKYLNFINPELVKFVLDQNNKMLAFSIVIPSFSKALQKARGKLFPLGLLYLLRAKKYYKDIVFYLIGIHPDFQNKGLNAVIFKEYIKTFKNKKIENCIRTPELIENTAVHQLWKNFNPKIYKRRRTYRFDL
ncbi:MAG: GTP cyclohydrolase [Tenacibaculum sp.]